MANHAEHVARTSPVDIPDNATVIISAKKSGSHQMEFRYHSLDDGLDYTSRWHTKTSRAPAYQGDSWVVERAQKGIGYGKNARDRVHQVLLDDGTWIDNDIWKAAKNSPNRTPAQNELLKRGHIAPKIR